ncbi:hypothetical protein BC828DRAFT_402817 [Blastocladiella britannica]|nr:hypothetical protein BC828DRAFT_402817 [Blastocladiella britannica]
MALSPSGSWSNGKSRRLTLSWTAHSARSACRDYDGFRVPGARWFGYLLLNLVALCIACNLIKNTNSFADFCAMAFAIDARFPNVPITTELPVTKFASGLGASHRTPSCDLDKESLLAPALAKLYSEKKAPCYLCGGAYQAV